MPKKPKNDKSTEIKIGDVKKVKEFNLAGQNIREDAPENYSVRSPSGKTKIEVETVEDVDKANIAGREIIKYREKDFKSALIALENVLVNSSLGKPEKKEFKELTRQIRQAKPGVDPALIRSVWGKIVKLVNIAGLTSGVAESVLGNAWKVIAGYLGIG